MRVLYCGSGHPLQESDDLLMLSRLKGVWWQSTGLYYDNCKPHDLPYIPANNKIQIDLSRQRGIVTDPPILQEKNATFGGKTIPNTWKFERGFVDHFDVIIFNHCVQNVVDNEEACRGKSVVLKTFGMHDEREESRINILIKRGLKVIRNSPVEKLRYGKRYAGCSAVIRGSIVPDEKELSGWVGKQQKIISFSNGFYQDDPAAVIRRNHANAVIEPFKQLFEVYGACNKNHTHYLPHSKKVDLLKQSRVSFIVGTPRSNNTYSFVESWVLGIPTVSFGPKLWQSNNLEIPDLVDNEINGFYSDNVGELQQYIKALLEDYSLAQYISRNARKKAVEIYGRKNLAKQWVELFHKLGFTEVGL